VFIISRPGQPPAIAEMPKSSTPVDLKKRGTNSDDYEQKDFNLTISIKGYSCSTCICNEIFFGGDALYEVGLRQ